MSVVQTSAGATSAFKPLNPPQNQGTPPFASSYGFGNLVAALRQVASNTDEGITFYSANNTTEQISYRDILSRAETNAAKLLQQDLSRPLKDAIVLVHFDNRLDSITWYWSVLLAGGTPCVTGPAMFSHNSNDRKKHLDHLFKTLKGPLCVTRRSLLGPFNEQAGTERIDTLTVEDIGNVAPATAVSSASFQVPSSDLAAIMLTSGSSGNAKAVPVRHTQVIASSRGKALTANKKLGSGSYMSWVDMDHVANLVHIHLFAVVSGVSQIQVPSSLVLVDPMNFLNMISRNRVSRTFAPHFLLAKLQRQLDAGETSTLDADLNLDGLMLETGGEANVTGVCAGLLKHLTRYGAPENVLRPSFGMTETCAGCTVNMHFPQYEKSKGLEFASLGETMPGISMRVSSLDTAGGATQPGERGGLELKGDVVFQGYFNNDQATAEAFTSDGWFKTGDLAYLDERGYLFLDGRAKEVININGVKYLPYEVDATLEEENISGARQSYFCTFSTRDASMDTEVVVVLYLPTYDESDDEARFQTQGQIVRVVSMHTRSRPVVIPLKADQMPKSTLGKLSRPKLKAALEKGEFMSQKVSNDEAIERYRVKTSRDPETVEEAVILDVIRRQMDMAAKDASFTVTDSILSTGATSMDLVAVMHHVNKRLDLHASKPVSLTDILTNPTPESLAAKIAARNNTDPNKKHEYDPVVTLQPHGSKTPLFLVHPGVGEVLVFVTLAHHVTDRPVYAFRAKGFNASEGEVPFKNLEEVFETYRAAIKKRQPHGPYAIAGYSFGGMVAFEIAKLLEAGGDEVRYCGSWNLPPHIKWRMRELVWDECVIHLFYFVGLMDEADAYKHKPALCAFEKQGRRLDAIRYLRQHCDTARWDELGLSEEYYVLWVGLASNMQGMAVDYEPSGKVNSMDVFVADPLTHVAKNRTDWIENRLSAWKEFVQDQDVQFHHVQGAHYTMLNAEYVTGFADTLRKVLKKRGL